MESKISQKAQQIHEELWPDYQSQAKDSDPELIEVFDNFAFDEVLSYGNMEPKTRLLMITATTIATQSIKEFSMMANAALNIGTDPVEIREIVYQAVPYCGINKVIDFIYTMNEIFKEKGIQVPLEKQSTTTPQNRHEKGLQKQKEIFGSENIENMYNNSPKDLLHIQHYLSSNCFGDYVTRSGLDVKTREMATLSFLIALGGTESQIKGHIRGNVNVGNDRNTLIDLITQLIPYLGYPRTLNAINCLNEILPTEE